MKQKQIIGRVDYADFPLLNLGQMPVKIDTGAFGCSMHCEHIEEKIVDAQSKLVVTLSHPASNDSEKFTFHTSEYWTKKVKSSSGISEERYFIKTEVTLFNTAYEIELSLTNRNNMKYPVLLGRNLLSKNFLVDTSRTFLSHKKLNLANDKGQTLST